MRTRHRRQEPVPATMRRVEADPNRAPCPFHHCIGRAGALT